ncbi:MAG: hypothetical protein JOY61_22930 [Chloroflexi bacterium]|nr:hypothetical protein [Chloroflexota bacterium]
MLSGVPARLEYACGHHALVSLQAVKGEGGQQRRRRIELEKAAALERPCDFCGPVLVLEESVEANGTMTEIATPADTIAAVEAIVEELSQTQSESVEDMSAEDAVAVEILASVEEDNDPMEELLAAAVVAEAVDETIAVFEAQPTPETPARRRAARPKAARPKATRRRTAKPAPSARFRVDFVGEREVDADSIQAAVARAEAMGLHEIIAVTRVG